MSKDEGRYEVHYLGQSGTWWVGHHGIDLKDPAAYVDGLNKKDDMTARILDKHTGDILGDPTYRQPRHQCSLCDEFHQEGTCLL